MKIALVCIAKDEDNYIKEWIDYHHKIGFDDIYIYENDWECKIDFPNFVHKIPFPGKVQQNNSYNHFLYNYSHLYDWCMMIDVDEYFVPYGYKNVGECLSNYSDYLGVGFNWKLFGSNGYDKVENNNYSVIQRFTKSQIGYNQHIKTTLNLSLLRTILNINQLIFVCPHCVNIGLNYNTIINAQKSSYVYGPFNKINDDNLKIPYIAHFITKSKEEFYERRSKCRADTETPRDDIEGFWKEHNLNETENLDVLKYMNN